MSRLFYHPLGNYAANYTATSSPSAKPHTRTNHGFNKIDYGCGENLPVYSMTNGAVSAVGESTDPKMGESKKFVCIRCVDNGYSEMMADLKSGNVEDYPIYISYIELSETDVEAGTEVSPGTKLGLTGLNSGSNVHIDIGAYCRWGGSQSGDLNKSNPNLITSDDNNQLAIGCRQVDAYGDKGITKEEILEKYLDSNFTYDRTGIKDSSGNYLGVLSNNHYYPPNSSGGAVLTQSVGTYPGGGSNSCPVEDFYHYMICLQTPIYQAGSGGATSNEVASGEESIPEIYQSLRAAGYGVNASLGMLGNMSSESGWKTDIIQSSFETLEEAGGGVNTSDYASWTRNKSVADFNTILVASGGHTPTTIGYGLV